MSRKLAGATADAITVDPETGEVTVGPALIEPETLQLILDTMQANSFNFIVPDLAVGTKSFADNRLKRRTRFGRSGPCPLHHIIIY